MNLTTLLDWKKMNPLITGFLLSCAWATAITVTSYISCLLGFGEPNICGDETLIGFYSFLWCLSFITVPLSWLMCCVVVFFAQLVRKCFA